MVSFSFIKKSTKSTKETPSNDKEYVTNFTNFEQIIKNNNPNPAPVQKKQLKISMLKRDIKDYVCNDVPINPTVSVKAAANKLRSQMTDRKYEDLIFTKMDKARGIQKKKQMVRKKENRKTETKKPVKGQYALVISGKYANQFGKVTYLSDDGDIVALRVDELDRDIRCRVVEVKPLKDDEYHNLINPPVSIEPEIEVQHLKQSPLINTNWLCSGLRVRIIDKKYREGRYVDQTGVIEDVNDVDQCVVVTDAGKMLSGLSEAMLTALPPVVDGRARVLGGQHAGVVVNVLEMAGSRATVYNEMFEDDFDIDISQLGIMSNNS